VKKTTKRLKAWVNVYEAGRLGSASESRKEACGVFCGDAAEGDREAIPFIEAHPGDVVLSRADATFIRQVLDEVHSELPHCSTCTSAAVALLRGGR